MKKTPLIRKTPMRRTTKPLLRGGFVKWPSGAKSIKKLTVKDARTGRGRIGSPLNRKPLPKRGKRTAEWDAVRRRLKPLFQRAGITRCELRLADCWRNNGLTFAHAKKRRLLAPGELEEVVLACRACHNRIEEWSHLMMFNIVHRTIGSRKTKVPRLP